MASLVPLPIDPCIPEIVTRVRERRALVLSAAPGAGKTTRVPPALAFDGPVIVLQPRRVAARSLARRIGDERGWTLGRENGWHVRFERQFSHETRVLLATEGILTRRLQQDPLLSDFRTIVLDEFHERSIHADLGLALARQAWLARDDLRLVVMSATLDMGRLSSYLGDAPVVHVPGRAHEITVHHVPSTPLPLAIGEAVRATDGDVLCFLAGAPEIRRASAEVARIVTPLGASVLPLHGSLSADEQDAALAPARGRRVILATNIAETSVTVPGVRAVVDTGLRKVARYDPARAIDSLDTERISRDSAEQRAGRAGRLGPGSVWRLWPAADRLRPHAEPEIDRIDLASPVMEVLAWGGDPRALDWFDPPSRSALDAAFQLLERLGAIDGGQLTPLGRRMQSMPLHPRLSRILLESDGAHELALACALLSERRVHATSDEVTPTTSSDLLSAVAAPGGLPHHVQQVARQLERLAGSTGRRIDETSFRRALFAGYPDRVARRRASGSPRVLLASGHGAVIGAESGVRDGDFLIALDVTAAPARPGKPASDRAREPGAGDAAEARIRLASLVDREWLRPSAIRVEHFFDEASETVRAVEREYYGAIVLAERQAEPDPAEAARLLAIGYRRRGLRPDDEQLLRRLRFAGLEQDLEPLLAVATIGKRALDEVDLSEGLSWEVRQALIRDAPVSLTIPGGRTVRLEYRADGSVMASVKLQALFGLAETPRIGRRQEPVLLALLAPNGRPVQLTRDLRSFWERTYPEVRKELRGRYPKHAWPEHP